MNTKLVLWLQGSGPPDALGSARGLNHRANRSPTHHPPCLGTPTSVAPPHQSSPQASHSKSQSQDPNFTTFSSQVKSNFGSDVRQTGSRRVLVCVCALSHPNGESTAWATLTLHGGAGGCLLLYIPRLDTPPTLFNEPPEPLHACALGLWERGLGVLCVACVVCAVSATKRPHAQSTLRINAHVTTIKQSLLAQCNATARGRVAELLFGSVGLRTRWRVVLVWVSWVEGGCGARHPFPRPPSARERMRCMEYGRDAMV